MSGGREQRRPAGAWVALCVLAALAAGFFGYVGVYYHADNAALAALESSEAVAVVREKDGWLFDGPGEEAALIFYPGGKVEAAAYAPLLREIAAGGTDCILTEMPFRLAVFDIARAKAVMGAHSYDRWYIGGHSLGGAMAADYAAGHLEELEGLVLLAAYPTKSLDREGFAVLSVRGSEDGVLNGDKAAKGQRYMPRAYTEVWVQGGNYAWFGSYGEQRGDGQASISHEDQWAETAAAILAMTAG